MQTKKFGNKIIFRLDKGEEVVESIKKICGEFGVKLGTVHGLGAAGKVTLGLFESKSKKYLSQELVGDFEICPLYGNISTMDSELYLHCHINIAGKDQKSFGGHLSEAVISATFEGVIDVIDGEVDRKFDEEIGLNLMEL